MSLQTSTFWLGVATVITPTFLLVCAFSAIEVRRRRGSRNGPGSNEPAAGEPDSLEQAKLDARRARRLASFAATLDLEDLLERVVEAAVEACGADAAGIALKEGPASGHIKTTGLRRGERAPSLISSFDQTAGCTLTARYPGDGDMLSPDPPVRTALLVGLVTDAQEQLGTLAVYWRRELEPDPTIHAALSAVAYTSTLAIQNAHRYEEAYSRAVFDGITGLYNRHYFDEAVQREVTRAHRYNRSLALLLLDLDGFKAVNDEHGHLAGDAVLKEFAEGMRSAVRGVDIACRVGGDEFGVLLPEASKLEARHLEERLHAALAELPNSRQACVGWSTGVAELQPGEDATSLFDRADQAMLQKKRGAAGGFGARGRERR